MKEVTGKIHSYESCGTVDGPGLRFVIFLQGCPLRCLYCHNPDTWDASKGKEVTVEEVVKEALKYKSYMRFSKGGVTISGGEPLIQKKFVLALLKRLKEEGLHTAVDTSGISDPESVKEIYESCDLVLLDLKCSDPKVHKQLTGCENTMPVQTLDYLTKINKPFWGRHVLVPGWTTKPELLESLAQMV
ncbi:MAG: pyruvate formate lyase-activating protein, partial [Lentisphaeria bacterium]|nr:pyruvate formate lyase-activating protein [Lentisphaeria bacterium]